MKPTEFQRFHNDLKAAVLARVPIEVNNASSRAADQRLTLSRLKQLETVAQGTIQPGEHDDALPVRYAAALRTFSLVDSMSPVLDGLTTRYLATRRVEKILRGTLVYLFVLFAIALPGLLLFSMKIMPAFSRFRGDLLLPAAINAPDRFDVEPWVPVPASILIAGLVILLLLIFGGAKKVAMWAGGRHYVRCRTSQTALQTFDCLPAVDCRSKKPFQSVVILPASMREGDVVWKRLCRTPVMGQVC